MQQSSPTWQLHHPRFIGGYAEINTQNYHKFLKVATVATVLSHTKYEGNCNSTSPP
jgi:hypothetical protein